MRLLGRFGQSFLHSVLLSAVLVSGWNSRALAQNQPPPSGQNDPTLPPLKPIPDLEPTRISAEVFMSHLALVREALTRKEVRDFLNEIFKEVLNAEAEVHPVVNGDAPPVITELLETQLLLFLRENAEAAQMLTTYFDALKKLEAVPAGKRDREWTAKRKALADDSKDKVRKFFERPEVLQVFRLLNDPLEPYWAETLDGSPSYQSVQLFVSHDYEANGVKVPAADLAQIMTDFVLSAQQEISANFYEFDLIPLADAFITQAKKGLKVKVGIDKDVIKASDFVKAAYKRMKDAGVDVVQVDATELNHQKLITIDQQLPNSAATIFSSANATVSDANPKGDLYDLPDDKRPKESIPNANHLLIVKGQLPAMVTFHQLEKILNPKYLLRGSEFPLSGAFRFRGPIDPATQKSKEIILAFTPGGGLRQVNKLLISRLIHDTSGPLYMAQFAFSSEPTASALVDRIEADLQKGIDPQFFLVGESQSIMQSWSQLLKLSGLKLVVGADGKKQFVDDPDAPIRKVLSGEKLAKFQEAVKVAPEIYKHMSHKIDGQDYETVAKLHHKVLVSGIASILGTSFNFSTGAESNNEQILVIVDSELAELGKGMILALWNLGRHSVVDEAKLHNERGDTEKEMDPDVDRRKRTRLRKPKPRTKPKPCEAPLT